MRALLFALVVASATLVGNGAGAAETNVSSLTASAVTVYSAKWCSACRALREALNERKIAFDVVDVDDNPSAFARARSAAGAGDAIPLTGVVRTTNTVWIVGNDAPAIERASRGE